MSSTSSSPVAVVTGGARGIGLAIGQWFLAHGHKVVLLDVDKATLDATGKTLNRPDDVLCTPMCRSPIRCRPLPRR